MALKKEKLSYRSATTHTELVAKIKVSPWILIETMTWTMLLYIGAVYGKYMDTWIKLIVAVILGMFPIVMLFSINNKS